MRTIGVVTGGRADYGILLPVLRAIQREPALALRLYVTGMHLAAEYGNTVQQIEADGIPIAERVPIGLTSDTPAGIAHSMALALAGFGKLFERAQPDILLVLGDRFEVLAAAAAATPFTIPIAHIGGGQITEGAIDDAMRHAITKLSHLHFVATAPDRDRVLQMGEQPWRVHLTGDPGLDHLHTLTFLSRAELERLIGLELLPAPLLVTFHPETLDYANTSLHVAELLAALENSERPIVFTAPNADTSGRTVRSAIEAFVAAHPRSKLVPSLGTQAYLSLMKLAAAMVGNSSSGIIEAASFELPVVDIGDRQRGRIHGKNVIHAAAMRSAIFAAIAKVLALGFRAALKGMRNPYGDGDSAEKIARVLLTATAGRDLLIKSFADLPTTAREAAR
ncbi:MAG: UDP-N-acetylglucosamine 2-epimerase (hydrolyzing) [Candidatus Koribacter versatilis]|uniref:UDP-N-acetylglucosamine 2-epimerase (Hydrolyzing) n=1 Tax=Candidatus Korobacter versatilis TaxID=658062 RepID=A0A932A6L3_9BACT|nr:UDP-N-acetylglucosamine 2-epimerase (hydrolyzing) [Candidatus Koribacter versatilis]